MGSSWDVIVEYTQIVASTKGSFKSLTAGAPAAETQEGRKDVKVATLRQEGPSSADRWHQVAEDLLLGFDQNCTFFPLTSYMETVWGPDQVSALCSGEPAIEFPNQIGIRSQEGRTHHNNSAVLRVCAPHGERRCCQAGNGLPETLRFSFSLFVLPQCSLRYF